MATSCISSDASCWARFERLEGDCQDSGRRVVVQIFECLGVRERESSEEQSCLARVQAKASEQVPRQQYMSSGFCVAALAGHGQSPSEATLNFKDDATYTGRDHMASYTSEPFLCVDCYKIPAGFRSLHSPRLLAGGVVDGKRDGYGFSVARYQGHQFGKCVLHGKRSAAAVAACISLNNHAASLIAATAESSRNSGNRATSNH